MTIVPKVVKNGKLEPWVIQALGCVFLTAFAVVWITQSRKDPELLMMGTGMYAYGATSKGGKDAE